MIVLEVWIFQADDVTRMNRRSAPPTNSSVAAHRAFVPAPLCGGEGGGASEELQLDSGEAWICTIIMGHTQVGKCGIPEKSEAITCPNFV